MLHIYIYIYIYTYDISSLRFKGVTHGSVCLLLVAGISGDNVTTFPVKTYTSFKWTCCRNQVKSTLKWIVFYVIWSSDCSWRPSDASGYCSRYQGDATQRKENFVRLITCSTFSRLLLKPRLFDRRRFYSYIICYWFNSVSANLLARREIVHS